MAMKKLVAIFICVDVLVLKGAFREDVHQRNIKFAITQFASSFTNDMMSTSYDFAAILGEIENLKSEAIRTNLLSDMTDRLIVNPNDIWKHQDALWFQRRRAYLMVKAMYSFKDSNIMFKWQRYLDLYQAMKSELKLYADVKDPDEYRERWIAEAREELMEKIRKAGSKTNLLIRGTVPISKARREAGEKWAYKKSIEREIARYEKRYFDSLVLKDDYRKLCTNDRKQLIEMVREGLGRYPKWYQKELDEKLK
jgi:hypothetical protein